jgi:hypothetical protein
MELVVVCAILAICCGFVLWDRGRLQRRARGAQERVAPPKEPLFETPVPPIARTRSSTERVETP